MKVSRADTIQIQQQFRKPEPLFEWKGIFNPLEEMMQKMKEDQKERAEQDAATNLFIIDLLA